jgi:hypothetical protein
MGGIVETVLADAEGSPPPRRAKGRDRFAAPNWAGTGLLSIAMLLGAQVCSAKQPSTPTPIVYNCPAGPSTADSSLERAIRQAVSVGGAVQFLTQEQPCVRARDLTRSLDGKLRKKYFALARNHAYSLIKANGNFFSVEQYVFADVRGADITRERLAKEADRSLSSPGVTGYQFVQVGNSVILFVQDVHSREATQLLIDAIAANLRAISAGSKY